MVRIDVTAAKDIHDHMDIVIAEYIFHSNIAFELEHVHWT